MIKQHEHYGAYYGNLVNSDELNYGFVYAGLDENETETMISSMKDAGVVDIWFDIEDEYWSDTMFFQTDENTDLKKLMLIVTNIGPNEFSEESDNHFRMWFD